MATRLYLTQDTVIRPPLSFTIGIQGTWDSSGPNDSMMWSDKTHIENNSSFTTTISETQSTNPWNMMFREFVSPRLEAQTIDGTVQLCIGAYESNISANASLRVHIFVLTPSNTVRGTLLSNYTDSVELGTVAATSAVSLSSPQTLSSVICQNGDRIVMEVGASFANATTSSMQVSWIWGGDPLNPDLNPGGNPLNGVTWAEFSDTITFLSTEAVVSQEAVETLLIPATPAARVSQEAVEVLLSPAAPAARLSQTAVEALLSPATPSGRLSQIAVEVLVSTIVPPTDFHRATIIILS